jgi:hypothetical protein
MDFDIARTAGAALRLMNDGSVSPRLFAAYEAGAAATPRIWREARGFARKRSPMSRMRLVMRPRDANPIRPRPPCIAVRPGLLAVLTIQEAPVVVTASPSPSPHASASLFVRLSTSAQRESRR